MVVAHDVGGRLGLGLELALNEGVALPRVGAVLIDDLRGEGAHAEEGCGEEGERKYGLCFHVFP